MLSFFQTYFLALLFTCLLANSFELLYCIYRRNIFSAPLTRIPAKTPNTFGEGFVSTSDFSTQSGMETKTFTLLTRSKRLCLLTSRQRPRRQTCRRTARVRMMRPSSLTISAKVTAPTGSLINYILPFIEERSLPCWDLTVLARPQQWKRWRDTEGPIKGVFASWGAIPYAKPSH